MVNLLLQKKHATDVISGTIKTVIEFMVFNIGPLVMSGVIQTFTDLFSVAFRIEGVTTQVEVATGFVLNIYDTEMTLAILLGFVVNLTVAKSTRFETIFLTGQRFLYFARTIVSIFIANDPLMSLTVIVDGILFGLCGAALPSFCQPFMNKITDTDNLIMGRFNCIGCIFSGYTRKLLDRTGKSIEEERDTSIINVPKFFGLFRGFIFSVALFMVILSYVAVTVCAVNGHMNIVLRKARNDIWFIYPFLQGLQSAAGVSVLIYGIHRFTAEITAAFIAISEKYILNSKLAVNRPAIPPFVPTVVLIGFVRAFVGGPAAMTIMVARNSSVIIVPAAGICFFSGGTYGVSGNVCGGWKGALVGSFIAGMALTGLPLILYPTFAGLGISEASFPNVDYNTIGVFPNWILRIFA